MSEINLYEPALVIGSPLGIQTICRCNWRSPICDDSEEAHGLYTEHVQDEHRCGHDSLEGVDALALDDAGKVWQCCACGDLFRIVRTSSATSRLVRASDEQVER